MDEVIVGEELAYGCTGISTAIAASALAVSPSPYVQSTPLVNSLCAARAPFCSRVKPKTGGLAVLGYLACTGYE